MRNIGFLKQTLLFRIFETSGYKINVQNTLKTSRPVQSNIDGFLNYNRKKEKSDEELDCRLETVRKQNAIQSWI